MRGSSIVCFVYSLLLLITGRCQIRTRTMRGCSIVKHAVHDNMIDALHPQVIVAVDGLMLVLGQLFRRTWHWFDCYVIRLRGVAR